MHRRLALCGLAALLATEALLAATPANVRLIAPGAEDERSPVFSPDGKWLVFVSDRDGDTNLRAMRADRPIAEPPATLAASAAEDHSPAFSPDGRWLAWVSTREDVFGDVWAMRFPGGEPFAVSKRGAIDRDPAWTQDADGSARLEWTAADHEGAETRMAARPGAWGDAAPIESGDPAPQSAIVLQHEDDTNGDGSTSEASGDWPSAWLRPENGGPWRQLTPPLRGLNTPAMHEGRLHFSAAFREDLDIAVATQPFEVATLADARGALAAARAAQARRPMRTFEIVALARQGYLLDPQSADGAECALLAVDALVRGARPEQALRMVRNVERDPPADAAQAARLEIRRLSLEAAVAARTAGDAVDPDDVRARSVDDLRDVAAREDLPADVRVEAAIAMARVLEAGGDAQAAFAALDEARSLDAGEAMRGRAALERARAAGRFAPEAAGDAFRALLGDAAVPADVAEEAAGDWMHLFDAMPDADRLEAIRRAAAQMPDSPFVQAAAALAEGEAHARAGRSAEAEGALREAMAFAGGAPRLAAQAAFALAEMQASEARYVDAVATYESVEAAVRESFFAEAPQFAVRAREGAVREFLARGAEELRLGDPQLAEATFRKLLEREPRLVEAWRGLLEARSRSGRLDDAERAQYRAAARAGEEDSLAWYVHGLAESYRTPIPKAAMAAVRRAIALDATVPYYHQTLGFLQEAQARAGGGRREIADAWDSYQRALALLDPAERPLDHARLLVNAGNAAMGLGLHARAADLYRQRLDQGVPFDDPRTEFLMTRQHGIALFRGFRASAAAERFSAARAQLDSLERTGLVPKGAAREIDIELQDRRALALMDAGRFADSAEEFRSVAERNGAQSLNRVRALRNRGVALWREARETQGGDAERIRREARRALEEALEILRDRQSLSIPLARQAGGMFGGLEFGITSSDLGGAALNLSPDDEERLIRAAMARLDILGGETTQAIEGLQRQLANPPDYGESTKAYHVTARLVALDQLASQQRAAGDAQAAAATLATMLRESRFDANEETIVNAGALANALVQLAETALAADEPSFRAADMQVPWLSASAEEGDALRALDACIEGALLLRGSEGELVVGSPERAAWLLLCRALLAERMARAAGEGIAAVRAGADELRADVLAEQVIADASGAEATAEMRRIAVLAWGARLRMAAARGDNATVELREQAQRFADAAARPELKWWLHAQESLAAPTALARGAAFEALNELEALPAGMWFDAAPVPHALLRHCRRLALDAAIDDGDWTRAFALDERWRTAALRLAAGRMTPPPPAAAEERAWFDQALALRRSLRDAAAVLRNAPAGAADDRDLARMERAAATWSGHLRAGREQAFATARLFAPEVVPVENPAAALADLAVLPSAPAVVLSTHRGAAAWTAEGIAVLDGDEAWNDLAGRASIWFVAGDAPLARDPETAIRLLTIDATAAALSEPRLDAGGPALLWPTAARGDERPEAAATRIALARELKTRGEDPFAWIAGGRGTTLGELLALAPRLEAFDARLDNPDGDKAALLAAAAASRGIVAPGVDGAAWSGILFPASLMPDIARDELDAAVGEVRALLEAGDVAAALGPARQVLALRGALAAQPEELSEAQLLVAQVLGDLGRAEEAAETSADAVALWREAGDAAMLAQALRIHASHANAARRFGDASDAYAEARALYEGLGDAESAATMLRRMGAAFENAGRIDDAMEAFEQCLALASEPREQAVHLRRIGRLHLLRLANYPAAEDAFRAALAKAEEAGAEDIAILANLDIGKCRERVGDYEQAASIAAEMRARAAALGDRMLECDALLLAAFVEWARADYLKAFRAQGEALAIAEEAGDIPYAIVARNTGGLVRWSLNDVDHALAEYDATLALARGTIFDGEVASTLNNRALVHRSMRQWDAALADLKESLSIDRARQDRWGEAYALRNIGMTHLMRGDAKEALEPLARAMAIAAEIGDRSNRAKAAAALGDALRETGDDAGAHEHYLDALSEARAIPLPEVEWRVLHGRAMLEKKAGRGDAALQLLDEALGVVERLRAAIRIEEFQEGFLLDKQQLYDEAVALLLERGDVAAAFECSERSRGRHFIDLLGNRTLDLRSAADDRALARERELRAAVEEQERRAGTLEGPDRDAAQARLVEARRRYADFVAGLRASNPQLSSFVEVKPATTAEIQELLDADTRLVVYHVLDAEIVAWVVGRDSIRAVRTPVARTELAARVQAWRERLQNFDRVADETAILSSLLVEPIAPLLDGAKRIGVVPHRELHLVPLAAMRLGDGHVPDRLATFNAPSASVLRFTFARRGASRGEGVLAVGNPDLGNAALSLPFAEKEAERLALAFPGATLATGSEATESWIAANIGRYAIVHIASHGEYDPQAPMMSAIRLAADGTNDGALTAEEVFGLSMDADLVALSACQTGLGRAGTGDDIVGLNRSFVYAGTRQVLSTLWRVDDVSTAVLVKHFYRNARDTSIDRAEALRRAQLEVRKRYPHPAHWSGMVLGGDWQ